MKRVGEGDREAAANAWGKRDGIREPKRPGDHL